MVNLGQYFGLKQREKQDFRHRVNRANFSAQRLRGARYQAEGYWLTLQAQVDIM